MSSPPKKEAAGVIAPPPLIYLPFLVVGLLLHFLWLRLSLFPVAWLAQAVGWTLLGLCAFLFTWCIRTFSKSGENIRVETPTYSLVTEGPFRYSRNPMYVGLTLTYVSVCLIFNSWWPLLLLPIVLSIKHCRVIKREEAYLDYRARVRRWA